MRVALFFDGKNHMKDLHRSASDRWLDHGALAKWVVEHVGGTSFFGAYYYTGIPNSQEDSKERHALSDLLDELERRPGFFVKRFNRRSASRDCPHCMSQVAYTEEKMVDTSLVADMIVLAARDAYDIAVVFSGDLDIAPGIEAIQALGKQGWIATFGATGLSRSLSRTAWSTINLLEHLDAFSYGELGGSREWDVPEGVDDVDQQMLRELHRAQTHFCGGGGFVGAHYFSHRWKGHAIPEAPELRRQSLHRLVQEGLVETYSVDGKVAIRVADGATGDFEPTREVPVHISEEDETVEIRLPEVVTQVRRRKLEPNNG